MNALWTEADLKDFEFLDGLTVADYAGLLISLKIGDSKEKQNMHRDLLSEADMQTALKILHQSHSLDSSLQKAADCSAKLKEMSWSNEQKELDYIGV